MICRSGLLVAVLLLAACATPQGQTPAPIERSQPSVSGVSSTTESSGALPGPELPGPTRADNRQGASRGGFIGPAPSDPPDARATPTSTLMAAIDDAMMAGELERAAAIAERGLRIDPRDAGIWLSLANVRLQQGRPAEAEALAQRAMSEAGDDRSLRREIQDVLSRATDARL